MKLILLREDKKRPYLSGVTAVILVGIAGLFAIVANRLMFESEAGRALFVLARVGVSVIPPFVWPGAVMIVALWLVLLVRVWQA